MTTNQNNHINREFLLNLEVQVERLRDIEYDKPKHIIRTCQDGLFGLEIENKEILPPIYSSINFFDSEFDGTTVWLIVEKDNKFGLIDGRILFTGSYNWTYTAKTYNQETIR